jgi:hypothetical protein
LSHNKGSEYELEEYKHNVYPEGSTFMGEQMFLKQRYYAKWHDEENCKNEECNQFGECLVDVP